MRIYSEKAILKAESYSDIFSSDKDEAKRQFRHYCKSYHPDVDDSCRAQEIFQKLSELYKKSSVKKDCADRSNVIRFKSKTTGRGFEMANPVTADTGVCTIYHTQTKVVFSYGKDFKKFYQKYLDNVKSIQYEDDKMKKQFSILFPSVLRNFEDENGNFDILIPKTGEVLNLGLIAEAYKTKHMAFPERHAAWIINRLYNLAVYMDFYHIVFNGFSLYNLWVSPEFHTILLLGGWEYAGKEGSAMAGCPCDVYKILPVKARDKHVCVRKTDLESIRQAGRELFCGSGCKNILQFLDTASGDDGELLSVSEWKQFENAVYKDFGERKFVEWDNVPYVN